MVENREIRESARISLERKLFGNVWISLLVCEIVVAVIVGFPSSISTFLTRISAAAGAAGGVPLLLIGAVLSGPLAYGVSRVYLKVARGDKRVDIKELFCGFREAIGDAFMLGLLRSVFIFLWSLLLIVPGIIKAYSYSMAFYIQQEAKDKNWRACLDESAMLTDGYKGKLFSLDLSFIGWYFVGLLCLGVGVLWVSVYHSAARSHFYEELKKIKYGDLSKEEEQTPDPFVEEEKGRDGSPYDLG